MIFEKGKKYSGVINLKGLERYISNDNLKERLAKAGFTDIKITSVNPSLRHATGVFSLPTQEGKDIPSQLTDIKIIE